MTFTGVTGNQPSTAPMPNIPAAPTVVEDPLLETLPGAVIAQQESPCVMRIGVVVEINEGTQITVRISGSDVLVNCSYQFPVYFPLLGDRVVVLKQDSQWFCVSQMSGPLDSNNPLFNASFELGAIGALPDGWTVTVTASGAGTPTLTVDATSSIKVTGTKVADFGTVSVLAGISTAEAYSTPLGAVPQSRWTAAYFLAAAEVGSSPPRFSQLDLHIQFLDAGLVVIGDEMVNGLNTFSSIIGPAYRRLDLALYPTGAAVAPIGTVYVRIAFKARFELPATSFSSFFIDNVILRQVG